MRTVAYLTDVEGRWDKLVDFCVGNSAVTLDANGLHVAPNCVFVFGGDAIDRGPSGRKFVATLLAAKRAQPDQVVLLAGNRDINKLRLARELTGAPPPRLPDEVKNGPRGELLRAILSQTMGARAAFDHRRAELADEGRGFRDDDVVQSYLDDISPNGPLRDYLSAAVLAHREEETLFLHGGVTQENLGLVPGRAGTSGDVDSWTAGLNEFYAESMHAYCTNRSAADGTPGWQALVDYQAPKVGSRVNQESVVYARPTDALGNPMLPPEPVIKALAGAGIRRVVVGHTPSGDCPALLHDRSGFELLLADNSYGRLERGSRVTIDEHQVHVAGTTELDTGEQAHVEYAHTPSTSPFLGQRDAATGRLVKAKLARGDYLTYRALEGYKVEQIAVSESDLKSARLVPPRL